MDPDQHILLAGHISFDDGHMAFVVQVVFVPDGPEGTVFAGQCYVGDPVDHLFRLLPVGDQIRHGDEGQVELLGEFHQFRSPGHGTVIAHDLAADAHRLQSCQPAQVRSGFRMARTPEHPAFPAAEGEHMARPPEVFRFGAFIGAFLDGVGPFHGRDPGSSVLVVDGYGKGSFMVVRVVGHHRFHLEPVQDGTVAGHADQALGMGGHEVDVVRSHVLRTHDQIPFIFPVGVIGDQDHFAGTDVRNGLFDGIKLKFFIHGFHSLKKSIFEKGFLGKAPSFSGFQHPFHIFPQDVCFQVHLVPGLFKAQGGELDGQRDQ